MNNEEDIHVGPRRTRIVIPIIALERSFICVATLPKMAYRSQQPVSKHCGDLQNDLYCLIIARQNTSMKDLSFSVTNDVLALGVKILTARVTGIKNRVSHPEFEAYKNSVMEEVRQQHAGKKYKEDLILAGFRDLHTKVGRSNRDYVASPEALRQAFLERGRFPHVNTLVDIYNLVSLKTGLALGAHDIAKVHGNITLRLTKGDEQFIPLGKTDPTHVFPGEYSYVDDGNNIICRLEVLQVEPTKIGLDAEDVFLIIQGNANTEAAYVEEHAKKLCELIKKYCGGEYLFLNTTSDNA